MKLKKLEITGFKSFYDKANIQFPQGISAVVGPNGCGKSNIIDALRWVMGEQSVKQLRGNPDLMQQVKALIDLNAERPATSPSTAMATSAGTPQPPTIGYINPDVWKQKVTAVFEGNRRQPHDAYVAQQHTC